jgi:hypothetical protein
MLDQRQDLRANKEWALIGLRQTTAIKGITGFGFVVPIFCAPVVSFSVSGTLPSRDKWGGIMFKRLLWGLAIPFGGWGDFITIRFWRLNWYFDARLSRRIWLLISTIGLAAAGLILAGMTGFMRLTENHIRQLHQTLLRHSDKDERHRGPYKTLPNNVVAFDADDCIHRQPLIYVKIMTYMDSSVSL